MAPATSPAGEGETDRFIPSRTSDSSTTASPSRIRRLLQISLFLNAVLLTLYVVNFFEENEILDREQEQAHTRTAIVTLPHSGDSPGKSVLLPPTDNDASNRSPSPAPQMATSAPPPKTPHPTVGVTHKLNNVKDVRALRTEISAARNTIENEFPGINASQANLEASKHGAVFLENEERVFVEKITRAILDGGTFTMAFGGMSDVAGHGNFFEDSYPIVFHEYMVSVFNAAGIEQLEVRNQAMGGVPSYPHSLCLGSMLGVDSDVIVWDFRMVERDPFLSELYLRQALMLPHQPAVMFKRLSTVQSVLSSYPGAGVHVIDETNLIKLLESGYPDTAGKLDSSIHCDLEKARTRGQKHPELFEDGYDFSKCPCPGQVKWHSGFMIHRLRAAQMALVYLRIIEEAAELVVDILKGSKPPPEQPPRYRLPSVTTDKKGECKEFCHDRFECATGWLPHNGFSLQDVIVDEGHHVEGNTNWEFRYPSNKEEKGATEGAKKCNYKDAKLGYYGDAETGWIFFELEFEADNLHNEDDKRMVGFCGDLDGEWFEDGSVLVLINQEDVAMYLDKWLSVGTLGVKTVCFSTDRAVNEIGVNELGFRVMEMDITMSITHIFWT